MKMEEVKVWLYRVQQRLAITRTEATALLALAALLLAGMVVRYVQGQPRAAPASTFSAADHRFQEGARRLHAARQKAGGDKTNTPPAASGTTRMNLNEATAAQLERLPRVGPVIGGRIAAYREAHGPFAEVGHLERVSGIGPKTMERLAPLLFVGESEGAPADSSKHAP